MIKNLFIIYFIGQSVTARLRKPINDGLFTGTVQAVDTFNNTYRISFDRTDIGTHSVPDYEVMVRIYGTPWGKFLLIICQKGFKTALLYTFSCFLDFFSPMAQWRQSLSIASLPICESSTNHHGGHLWNMVNIWQAPLWLLVPLLMVLLNLPMTPFWAIPPFPWKPDYWREVLASLSVSLFTLWAYQFLLSFVWSPVTAFMNAINMFILFIGETSEDFGSKEGESGSFEDNEHRSREMSFLWTPSVPWLQETICHCCARPGETQQRSESLPTWGPRILPRGGLKLIADCQWKLKSQEKYSCLNVNVRFGLQYITIFLHIHSWIFWVFFFFKSKHWKEKVLDVICCLVLLLGFLFLAGC